MWTLHANLILCNFQIAKVFWNCVCLVLILDCGVRHLPSVICWDYQASDLLNWWRVFVVIALLRLLLFRSMLTLCCDTCSVTCVRQLCLLQVWYWLALVSVNCVFCMSVWGFGMFCIFQARFCFFVFFYSVSWWVGRKKNKCCCVLWIQTPVHLCGGTVFSDLTIHLKFIFAVQMSKCFVILLDHVQNKTVLHTCLRPVWLQFTCDGAFRFQWLFPIWFITLTNNKQNTIRWYTIYATWDKPHVVIVRVNEKSNWEFSFTLMITTRNY